MHKSVARTRTLRAVRDRFLQQAAAKACRPCKRQSEPTSTHYVQTS